MKRLLLVFLLCIYYCFSFATVKTWVGASGNSWNNATFWSPAGVPTSSDDVIFNTSVTVIIDFGLSPIPLNSLQLTNNSTVLFQTSGTNTFRLYSTSSVTPALLIDAGSTFTLDATNTSGLNNSTLDLTVATGCIGNIYGTLNLSCTGVPNSGPNLKTYSSPTNYGVVTVYNGGKIRILPGAANTVSSLTPVSTIVMQSGSTYENLKNGGSFPMGTWDANSLARALSPGSNGPVFNGNSYGNLEWNCPSQTVALFLNDNVSFNNVNLISTHKSDINGDFRVKTGVAVGIFTMTINGTLNVGTDARLVTSSGSVIATNGGNIEVKGNINNQGFIVSNGVAGTVNNFLITGTTAQTFTNDITTGIFGGTNLSFTMNNPAGLTLLTPLTLPYNADFTNGKIFTTSSNILTMVRNAVYTNASVNSFVEGPMKKIGDENFTFPLGAGSMYTPISITGGTGAATNDAFTAQYIRTNPQSVHGSTVQSGMNHISYVEYWSLVQNTGAATKIITLPVNYTSFCYDLSRTYVSRWNGTSFWTNESSSYTTGPTSLPYVSGTISSVSPLASFGDFTFITDLPVNNNPLPIKLISFNAIKNNSVSKLNWELATCCSSAALFEVEKSEDAKNFSLLTTINGSEINKFYSAVDNRPAKGVTYYRLKMSDYDGKISYSQTVAVFNNMDGIILTSLIPTIIHGPAVLTITSSKEQKTELLITDMMGRVVYKQDQPVSNGSTMINLSLDKLSNGIYQVFGISAAGKTNVIRFLKE